MSEPTARQIAERFYTHLPAYRRDSLAEAIEQRVATLTADLAQARQEIETVTRQRQQAGQDYYAMRDRAEAAEAQLSEARRQLEERGKIGGSLGCCEHPRDPDQNAR